MPKRDMKKLREKAITKTKEKLKKQLLRRDNFIVQAVKTIDHIDKSSNILLEQLKDWYALYFPELARIVREPDEYLILLTELKKKEDFTTERIVALMGEKRYRLDVPHAAGKSMGAPLKDEDIDEIAKYGKQVLKLRDERKRIEEYLGKVMKEEAPNIEAVVGPVIGARIISTAGSLEKLARMPSSTVQVLGAEKALFAHLKKKTPPPKHGTIFQYPKLRGAPKPKRGKIARRVAAKLSIAAKVDFYKGEFCGDRLAEELDNDITRILGAKK